MYRNYEYFLEPRDDYIILLDDLEFGMSKEQLNRILELHNKGWKFEKIAKFENRDPYEVICALLHLSRSKPKQIKKPLAYRVKGDLVV
jgi:hypothetical protein